MRRDQAAYLLDMLVAARDAVEFAEDVSYQTFAMDPRQRHSQCTRRGTPAGYPPYSLSISRSTCINRSCRPRSAR